MVNTRVDLGRGFILKNPVMTASGTFGYGSEYADLIDLSKLGAIIVKGTTLEHREGNPYPRMAETPSGMLNAVGLQNKGVDYFINEIYPDIKEYNTEIVVNVSGARITDYIAVAEKLNDLEKIHSIEVNISCPNVKHGGMSFGTTCEGAREITKEIRRKWNKQLTVKLTPNITDIVSIARSVEDAGADAVSLVNTFLGMAIDVERQQPLLSTITGGLSGPAIRPIAVRMVWQVAKAVSIPVIGLGGIMNGRDAVEFILAGATAIQIGTANFVNPLVTLEVIEFIENYCSRHNIKSLDEIRGII